LNNDIIALGRDFPNKKAKRFIEWFTFNVGSICTCLAVRLSIALKLAQLYGMRDNISFNLADAGYNVAKYVPYGPIKEVMPYLVRRAEENSSMSSQAGEEIAMLQKEINNRD